MRAENLINAGKLIVREEFNYEMAGRIVTRIEGDSVSGVELPTTFHNKPISFGSMITLLDTGVTMYYGEQSWVEFGTAEQFETLENPVDTLTANTDVNFTLTDSGNTEVIKIGNKKYNIPIFSAENDDTIYESEAANASLDFVMKAAAAGYDFKFFRDNEEVENPFNADLRDRVEVLIYHNTNPAYGVLLYIDTTVTPDPLPTFTINDHDYEFENGMTFEQFVESEHNPTDEWELVIGTDDVVFLGGGTNPVKDEFNAVQKKADIIENKTYYSPTAPMFAFNVAHSTDTYNFGFPKAVTDISTFAEFADSDYNTVESDYYIYYESSHKVYVKDQVNNLDLLVQDNDTDVAETDVIVENKTYTGVE